MTDTYGRLAALRPANTDEADLYLPGAGEQAIVLVEVCNQTTSDAVFYLALTDGGTGVAAADEDWLVYGDTIQANSSTTFGPYTLNNASTHVLRVKVGTADAISFVVHGLEMT